MTKAFYTRWLGYGEDCWGNQTLREEGIESVWDGFEEEVFCFSFGLQDFSSPSRD